MPWSGHRVVMAGFVIKGYEAISSSDHNTLLSLGFHPPDLSTGDLVRHGDLAVLERPRFLAPTVPVIFELFAGTGRVTACLRRLGLHSAHGIDHVVVPEASSTPLIADLTTLEGQQLAMFWISNPLLSAVFAAPPCGTCSRARDIPLPAPHSGPAPLRSASYPDGLPSLTGPNLSRVQAANACYEFLAQVATLCHTSLLTACRAAANQQPKASKFPALVPEHRSVVLVRGPRAALAALPCEPMSRLKAAWTVPACCSCTLAQIPPDAQLLRQTPLSVNKGSLPDATQPSFADAEIGELAWGIPHSPEAFLKAATKAGPKGLAKFRDEWFEKWEARAIELEQAEKDLKASSLEPGALVSRRFGILQGTGDDAKARLIDDMSASTVNSAVQVCESPQPHSIDVIGCLLLECLENFPRDRFLGRSFDLKSAYRQLGLSEDALQHAYVAFYDQEDKLPSIHQLSALPFGAVRSVHSFLRVSHSLWEIGCSLGLLWACYFDDFPVVAGDSTAGNTTSTVTRLFNLLGVSFNLEHFTSGRVEVSNTASR
ncbi:unnamed protein product, partial [Symbiodinium sp. CCMP2456]